MNKRGQIYLVAAIIIVMILAGVASVKTYAVSKTEPRKIQDISSELREETSRIIDYGIYSRADLNSLLNNFNQEFSRYFLEKTDETNIIFIYGNKTKLYSVQYNNQYTGAVFASIGGASPTWSTTEPIVNKTEVTTKIQDNKIKVNILKKDFIFDINEGEVFYFLITQQKDNETFIEKSY
jgi:hypothetical protein